MTNAKNLNLSIVTWNVNSLRTRLMLVLDFLREYQPDIVLLQELKLEEDKFPYMEIEELGYNCAVYGQKSYNGVAILSKSPLEDIRKGLSNSDEQARYIEAVTYTADGKALRVASVYVPNGQEVGSEKFSYKLGFLKTLSEHLAQLLTYEEICVIGGDYNVAYLPQDVYDPSALDGSVCYHPEERAALRILFHQGYYDAFRVTSPDEVAFSWWDYRAGSFERDHGLRIDHLLLSPQAVDRLTDCRIIKQERAKDKPSDHAPVWCDIEL